MSIFIKGMKMPKDCISCRWHHRTGVCTLTGMATNTGRDCPLVEVPTPHGRLIDAMALFTKGFEQPTRRMIAAYKASEDPEAAEAAEAMLMAEYQIIKTAPTVIEAEEDLK